MKRMLALFLLVGICLSFCGCNKINVKSDAQVTLTFVFGEQNIYTQLPDEEAEKVASILDGETYRPIFSGVPACGFDKNISLKVNGRVYAIACDTCNVVQDLGNLRYFDIAKADMDYIHGLFEKYGGHFPCI